MNPRLKLAPPVLEIAVLVVVVLIGWAAFRVYQRLYQIVPEVRESLNQLSRLRDEYNLLSEFVQTNVNEMHNAVTNYVQNKSTNDLVRFEQICRHGRRWLGRQRMEAATGEGASGEFEFADDSSDANQPIAGQPELTALLDQVNASYSNYIVAAQTYITHAGPGLLSGRLAADAELEQSAENRLLVLASQASESGNEMKTFLEGLANWSRDLPGHFRRLRFDLFGLVGLCFLALLLLYGRRFETRAVIRGHLEEQVRLDKLAHFGRLAQDHAHEIKQPLTAIKARLHTLQKELQTGSGAHKDAVVIGGEINRLDQIVKNFLRQARPTEPHPVSITADAAAETVRDLMASQLEQGGIELKLEVEPGLKLRADPQQLQQVLINLVKNAAESIDGHGTITLRAKHDRRELKGHAGPVGTLEVEDTGRGIAPEIQGRIFDPFFSTKNDGQRAGAGDRHAHH
jgi:signal transduction histidine kinase